MKIWRIHIPKSVLMLLLLAVILNILRFALFGNLYFAYLLWNIFLALLPFIISSILLYYAKENKLGKVMCIVGGIFWFLLIPNAPYIVTDLIHITHGRFVTTALYDSFLLFSSALVGLVLGMYSLSHINQILSMKFKKQTTNLILIIIMLFTSFGMYLGRFLRFNSWDVFNNPASFVKGIINIVSEPASFKEAYLYTGLFFLFIYMSYNSWKYAKQV